jgi:hypothetical protein
MSHTIHVTDLTDQDAVHRVLTDIQNLGTSYSLVQDEIEVAKIVPAEVKKDWAPGELREKRLKVLARMDVLAEKIAAAWSTDETAVEAMQNNRREL